MKCPSDGRSGERPLRPSRKELGGDCIRQGAPAPTPFEGQDPLRVGKADEVI